MPARRSLVGIIRFVVVAAGAAMPAAANAQRQALMVGPNWAGWVNQGQAVEMPLPTGGKGVQLTVLTNYVPTTLLDFIAASIVGKVTSTGVQYATYDAAIAPLNLWKIANTRLLEVDLPVEDVNSTMPAYLGIRFAPAPFEMGKPTSMPEPNSRELALQPTLFRLQFDNLDAPTVRSIGSMAIRFPDVLKGANLPQLIITFNGPQTSLAAQTFVNGLNSWKASQALKNGTLTFFAHDLKTVLMIARFQGLRVASILSPINAVPWTATFTMTGISLQAAPAP